MEVDSKQGDVDTKMKAELSLFLDIHQLSTDALKSQSVVVLLTGDRDFSSDAKRLGILGFNVVGIHNGKASHAFLDTLAAHRGTWLALTAECTTARSPSPPTATAAARSDGVSMTSPDRSVAAARLSGAGAGAGAGAPRRTSDSRDCDAADAVDARPLVSLPIRQTVAEFLKRFGKPESELLDLSGVAVSAGAPPLCTAGVKVVLTDYPYHLQVVADADTAAADGSSVNDPALIAALQQRLEEYLRGVVEDVVTVQGVSSVDLKADEHLRGLSRAHSVFPFVVRGATLAPRPAAGITSAHAVGMTRTAAAAAPTPSPRGDGPTPSYGRSSVLPPPTAAGADADPAKLRMSVPVHWKEADVTAYVSQVVRGVVLHRVVVSPAKSAAFTFTWASLTLNTRAMTPAQVAVARQRLLAHQGRDPRAPEVRCRDCVQVVVTCADVGWWMVRCMLGFVDVRVVWMLGL